MRVLIVEDDRVASDRVAEALRSHGHAVDQETDGARGLERARAAAHDVLVVDRMLPSLDGLALIEALRGEGRETPVMIVSALAEVDERVRGLRAGGDDYLVKPFALAELSARLEVLARRVGRPAARTRLAVGDLELDLLTRVVRRGGKALALLPRELQLLEFLLRHAGQVVTRTMLLESVWDYHFDPRTNVIDVHVSRLRRKIDKGFQAPLLHTVRGAGYVLRE